jgi:hypothetical protein
MPHNPFAERVLPADELKDRPRQRQRMEVGRDRILDEGNTQIPAQESREKLKAARL